MTATEDRLSPEFVAKSGLEREGTGYVKGRIDAGDLRLDYIDAYDFGQFYAAKHERALDLPELYAEFVAQRQEANDSNDSEGES